MGRWEGEGAGSGASPGSTERYDISSGMSSRGQHRPQLLCSWPTLALRTSLSCVRMLLDSNMECSLREALSRMACGTAARFYHELPAAGAPWSA